MGFWTSAAAQVVYDALQARFDTAAEDREAEMERYANFRDGRPVAIEQYFTQRPRETNARFEDRPKLSWPLCRSIVDIHAEALVKGISTDIADPATNDYWQALLEANESEAFWTKVAKTAGTYGACWVRPVLTQSDSQEAAIEFDSLTPLEFNLITDGGAGRSKIRIRGVTIRTAYHIDTGLSMPWPVQAEVKREFTDNDRIQERVELITPDRWMVWLDGDITQQSPFGDIWMPDEQGGNPYGFIPGALFNNLETEESVLGASDIRQSVYDVHQVNELWSDIVYASRHYVPMPVLKTSSPEAQKQYTTGIGAGMMIGEDDDFNLTNPAMDWEGFLLPFKTALELAYANAKMPAMAAGMEHTMRSSGGADVASGKSKAISYRPLVNHAMEKRRPFTRGIRGLAMSALRMAANEDVIQRGEDGEQLRLGLGVSDIDWRSSLTVEYSPDVIPTDKLEDLERYTAEILADVRSRVGAMQRYHGWDEARAAREADMIEAEKNAHAVDLPMKDIVTMVEERQQADTPEGEISAAAEKVFGPVQVMAADEAAENSSVAED